MSTLTPDQAQAAFDAAMTAAKADPTPETFAAAMRAQDDLHRAEQTARRAATTPHVTKPGKPMPKGLSGPRYFNLMRAMEADLARGGTEYAAYRPTTYCGAPFTSWDGDRRAALAAKNTAAVAAEGVCPDCLRTARAEATR
jgi:hypothetical protein